jgi:hypothetical protein
MRKCSKLCSSFMKKCTVHRKNVAFKMVTATFVSLCSLVLVMFLIFLIILPLKPNKLCRTLLVSVLLKCSR